MLPEEELRVKVFLTEKIAEVGSCAESEATSRPKVLVKANTLLLGIRLKLLKHVKDILASFDDYE